MKLYMSENQLRLVGKSWQIRAKLRELARSPITLQQLLSQSKKKSKMS
jgi:hypothetical protein